MDNFDPHNMRSMMDFISNQVETEEDDHGDILLKFVENCIFLESQSHHWHLQSDNYDLHMILEELYEDLPELVDSLVEGLMSNRGNIFSTGSSFQFQTVDSAVSVLEGFSKQCEYIHDILDQMEEYGSVSDVDDLLALVRRILYKLKVL